MLSKNQRGAPSLAPHPSHNQRSKWATTVNRHLFGTFTILHSSKNWGTSRLSPVFPLSTARFGRRSRHIRALEGYQGPKLRIELLVVGHDEGYELCPVEKLNR